MKTINWVRVLNQHHIEFVERGANVAKGHINIHCPFCGQSDPSHHMGLDLDTGYWGCWRNENHRGKSPIRLLTKLLNVSYARAREMAGLDESYIDPEGFNGVLDRLAKTQEPTNDQVTNSYLQFPREFFPITSLTGKCSKFVRYLTEKRGFWKHNVLELAEMYRLRAAIDGDFKDRIILPYIFDDEIVSWTGRAIAPATIRYKDLSVEQSTLPPKRTLFNYDAAVEGGDVLLVVEGPFDVLKLDFYGRKVGVRSVALSTNNIMDDQIYLLEEVSGNFQRVIILMDNSGTLGVIDSFKIKEKLSNIRNLDFTSVPFDKKDGGELLPTEVLKFCRGIIK